MIRITKNIKKYVAVVYGILINQPKSIKLISKDDIDLFIKRLNSQKIDKITIEKDNNQNYIIYVAQHKFFSIDQFSLIIYVHKNGYYSYYFNKNSDFKNFSNEFKYNIMDKDVPIDLLKYFDENLK